VAIKTIFAKLRWVVELVEGCVVVAMVVLSKCDADD
jgi:hypothetical protein